MIRTILYVELLAVGASALCLAPIAMIRFVLGCEDSSSLYLRTACWGGAALVLMIYLYDLAA